jgi:TonB family protein
LSLSAGLARVLLLLALVTGAAPATATVAASPGEPAPSVAPPSVAPPSVAPLAVVPPRRIGEAVVEYPPTATGAAEVLLELVVAATGEVREVRVLEGSEPFAAAAVAAAQHWRFEPARRGAVAVAARIRFQLRFAEPERVPASQPEAAPESVSPPKSRAPAAPIAVTVSGRRPEPLARSFTRAEVRQLPGAFGDAFRAIEALPGVTPIASGVPFFYVRGAPPGNVGYFLEGIRLPLLYHVGLGPSVVHPALVSRVDLYPGAYPSRYGRFAGGIVAAEVNEPGEQLWGEWQLRLFDVGALAEAPFAGGRGHILLGGRYSYTAYLISLLGKNVRAEYWDYQARASYRLSAADTLGVFVFGSFDYFGEDTPQPNDDIFSTEFHRIDLHYRHEAVSGAQFSIGVTLGLDRTRIAEDAGTARDRRLQVRSDYQARLSPSLELRTGVDAAIDAYSIEASIRDQVDGADPEPPRLDPNGPVQGASAPPRAEQSDDEIFRILFPSRLDQVAGAYAQLSWEVARGVRVVPGLRTDVYASAGALALSVEPRISAEFRLAERLTLTHGIGLAAQPPSFVVPVAGFEIGGLPGGLQRSLQTSAGAEYALPEGMTLSLTAFQNAFFNMTDVLSLARASGNEDLQPDTRTRGHAYGLEFSFHRDLSRRLGGFFAYTLSRSLRSSPLGSIPSSFDRTHVLNAALGYDLGRHFRLGGRLLFYTGNPSFASPLPETSMVASPGALGAGPVYESPRRPASRGGARLPAFHRLDVRIEKRWPFGDAGAFCAVALEVLNTTLSKETLSRNCDSDGCEDEVIGPVTIPSLSFEGRF